MIRSPHATAPVSRARRQLVGVCVAALLLSSCDRLPFDQSGNAMEQAQQKQAAQDYRGAVALYEKALDGTSRTADAHFRLGLIYDKNLKDPLSAVHHFRRYVEVAPTGLHAKEARDNTTRIEPILATALNGGTLINHAEALRLRQENTDQKTQIATLKAALAANVSTVAANAGLGGPPAGKAAEREAQRRLVPGTRTYEVQAGDTLASIARKFYKSKERAKDIQDANQNAISDPKKLKRGQVLIIP